jgi:hypothetical protein
VAIPALVERGVERGETVGHGRTIASKGTEAVGRRATTMRGPLEGMVL